MVINGVDYSLSRPDPARLYRGGYRFAIRYVWTSYSPGSAGYPGKMLTKSEADRLRNAGLAIVSNFESRESRVLDGYAAGQADARTAVTNTKNAGGPADVVVYFSVDFDASTSQMSGPITAYLRGAGSILGVSRVGIYGGYKQVKYAADHNLATWYWQTFAWSGGSWDSRAHIRQVRNNVNVCGGAVDLNEARRTPYGAWGSSAAAPATGMFTDLDLT